MNRHRIALSIGMVLGLLALMVMPLVVPQPVMADSATAYSTKDTYLEQNQPHYVHGDEFGFAAGGIAGSTAVRGLVHFTLPTVPSGATITGVSLRLYYGANDGGSTAGRIINVGALWPDRNDWTEEHATWTNYKRQTAWTSAGCTSTLYDYKTTGMAEATVPSSFGWMAWTVTTAVTNAYNDGQTTIGFRVKDRDENSSRLTVWWAKEYGSLQPQLVVTYSYTPPVVAPTVTTQPAGSIGTTSAVLWSYLDSDGGESCTMRFQWGTTSAYGSNTLWQSGYVTGNQYSRTITGLAPGTVYHFRGQAANSAGTSSGADATFATLPNPPSLFTATAGNTEVSLTWTKGTGAVNTMVRFSTSSYPASPTSGTQVYFNTGTTTTHTGLTNGTTYYYSAWSWANNTYSTRVTDAATPTAPAAPTCTTNAATAVTTDAARLHMNLDSLGGAASADVSLQWYEDGATAWGNETTPSTYYSTGPHYSDIGSLNATTLYHFRAKAVSIHGTAYGSSRSFTTDGPSAPTMTTNAATGITRTGGTINAAVTDDGGADVTGWFQWGESEGNLDRTTETLSALITGDTYYYGLTGLSSGTTYFYRAAGENSEGIAYGGTLNFTTSLAAAPTVRTDAATPAANQATLKGTVLTDGGATCEVRFQYGLNASYGTDTPWVSGYSAGQAFNALITGLTVDTTYHYRAQVQNEGGIASGGDATLLTLFAAPTDLVAKPLSQSSIALSWVLGGDQTLIRYSSSSYPADSTSGTQAYFGAGTSTTLSGLDAGTTYYFRAWSWREGNILSGSYADEVATTLIIAPGEDTIVEPTPDTPSSWFAMPTGKALTNIPFYDEALGFADSIQLPRGTFWFILGIGLLIAVGGLSYRITHKAVVAILVTCVFVVILTAFTMMPLWFLIIYLAFGGGITFVSQRV